MKMAFVFLLALTVASNLNAQNYSDTIAAFRKKYVADLMAEPRQPLKPSQVKFLDFYKPDIAFRVWAAVTETPGSVPFMVQTHSGKAKPFKEFGYLTFTMYAQPLKLHIYQSVDLMKNATTKDELFIMYNDMTNYETTYAGGRYIDLSIKDIKDGMVLLDFNKSYNPYCAYSDGYSCPIPPTENRLHVEIKAGEKMFQH
jgi:uncharacterized protein